MQPVPALLIRYGDLPLARLERLFGDARFELMAPPLLTDEWVAFARRAGGAIVATAGDPFSALVYALTAGVSGTLVLLVEPHHVRDTSALIDAGASVCLPFPVDADTAGRVLGALAHQRRTNTVDSQVRFVLDPLSRTARRDARTVRLSPREFSLLYALSSRGGRPVATTDLFREVWSDGRTPSKPQIVDVYVYLLRRKLARIGLLRSIRTVRGYGYELCADSQDDAQGAIPRAPAGL